MDQALMDEARKPSQHGGVHAFLRSFAFAAQGIAYAFRTQRNMRIHVGFAVAAVLLGLGLRIGAAEWAAVLVCIVLVLASECMNTAMEALVDGVSPEYTQFAKHAKDCAAGCVLLCALGSVAVAVVVYGSALMRLMC